MSVPSVLRAKAEKTRAQSPLPLTVWTAYADALDLLADAYEAIDAELDVWVDRECPPLVSLLDRIEETAK